MQQLTPEQVKLVLRRAAELERTHQAEPSTTGPTVAEIREIAREVGIEASAVERALGELRSGALVVQTAGRGEGSFLDRALGPADVTVERLVPGTTAVVGRQVERFLKEQLLQVRRHFGDRIVWEQQRGLWTGLQRALNLSGRYAFLPDSTVESSVAQVEDDAALVRFTLRLAAERKRRVTWSAVGTAAGTAVAALGVMFAAGPIEAMALVGGAGAAAGTVLSNRNGYRQDLERATLAVERLLDGLERGR